MFRLLFGFILLFAVSSQALSAVKWNNSGGSQTLINVELKDDFEKNRLKMYEQMNLVMESIAFQRDNSGNQYIALTSKQGQLEHHNRGQLHKYIKDRVELGTYDLGSDLKDKLIWYGFRVRLPESTKAINANSITFSQFKQIQKNIQNKDCHSIFWRMNHEDTSTWYAVTDENNTKVNKTYKANQITNDWSEFKIGTYLTENEDGWLKAYRNSELIYAYNGRTIMNEFEDCNPIKPTQTYIRIGVYRGSPIGWKQNEPDTLYFDDFVIATNEKIVNEFLSSTATNPDGSSKRQAANDMKALIIQAKKLMRTDLTFRRCLIDDGADVNALNMVRFNPESKESIEIYEIAVQSGCLEKINQ